MCFKLNFRTFEPAKFHTYIAFQFTDFSHFFKTYILNFIHTKSLSFFHIRWKKNHTKSYQSGLQFYTNIAFVQFHWKIKVYLDGLCLYPFIDVVFKDRAIMILNKASCLKFWHFGSIPLTLIVEGHTF